MQSGKDFTERMEHTRGKKYLVTNESTVKWIPKTPELYWPKRKPKGRGCIKNSKEKLHRCCAPEKNPYTAIPEVSKFWKNIINREKLSWKAPKELHWRCQYKAYPILPPNWKSSCTLGIIQQGFFLSPRQEGKRLRIKKRYLIKSSQQWRNDEWPPETLLKPMDQLPGHRMEVGDTELQCIC